MYRKLYELDYVVIRLANPYGPWQHPHKGQGVIAALTFKALKGDVIEIWGDGTSVRDYIYIVDAVEGVIAAANIGKSGEVYNIGSSIGRSINQIIEIIGDELGKNVAINYTSSRSVDVARNVLDITKISEDTGWKPITSIQDGIANTIKFISSAY